jgi:hypothetical protein
MNIKRTLIFLALILTFGTVNAYADQGKIILDTISKAEAEQLNIVIPTNTPPGHHTATIQIVDPTSGIVSSRDIQFCMNADGTVSWDNVCKAVTANGAYDPSKDLNHVVGTLVTSLALLNALGSDSNSNQGNRQDNNRQQGSLESIDIGARVALRRKQGRGDKSRTWRWPFTFWFDREMGLFSRDFAQFSPLISRVFSGGSYLRAILGSLTALLYPSAIYLGLHLLEVSNWLPMPASVGLMLLGIAIGVADALAGLLVAFVYFVGVLIAGHMHGLDGFLGTLGVVITFFAPILISSSLRPLRRHITDSDSLWERATDYALAILLTGWVVQKMIAALPGLYGKQVALTQHANSLGIYAGVFVAIRFLVEELGTYLYPERTLKLAAESKPLSRYHKHASFVLKVVMFFLVAEPFIGNSPELWIGTVMFAAPIILKLYSDRFPKTTKLNWLLPSGAFNIIFMLFVGAFFAKVVHNAIPDPHKFLHYGFVVLGLPGLVFSIAKLFSNPPKISGAWRTWFIGRWFYRLAGLVVYVLIVLDVAGKDLVTPVQHFFGYK